MTSLATESTLSQDDACKRRRIPRCSVQECAVPRAFAERARVADDLRHYSASFAAAIFGERAQMNRRRRAFRSPCQRIVHMVKPQLGTHAWWCFSPRAYHSLSEHPRWLSFLRRITERRTIAIRRECVGGWGFVSVSHFHQQAAHSDPSDL